MKIFPILIVNYLILLNSFAQALAFSIVCCIFLLLNDVLPEDVYRKTKVLFFGKTFDGEDLGDEDQFGAALHITPVLVLAILGLILALNQIALEEGRFRSAYNAARCEAGIECKK